MYLVLKVLHTINWVPFRMSLFRSMECNEKCQQHSIHRKALFLWRFECHVCIVQGYGKHARHMWKRLINAASIAISFPTFDYPGHVLMHSRPNCTVTELADNYCQYDCYRFNANSFANAHS